MVDIKTIVVTQEMIQNQIFTIGGKQVMLSSVLRSQVAVSVSIQITNAFLEILNIRIMRNILKKFIIVKKLTIFALTIPVLLQIRTIQWFFFKERFSTQDNTPPMPLLDAHLGGFLVL